MQVEAILWPTGPQSGRGSSKCNAEAEIFGDGSDKVISTLLAGSTQVQRQGSGLLRCGIP